MEVLNRRTLFEVYLILNRLGEEYIKKIPTEIYNYIIKNKENQTSSNITISREAIAIIATMHYKYWVNSKEEKEILYDIFNENEQKRKEKLKPVEIREELFDKKEKIYLMPISEVKKNKNWYTKIINYIKGLFSGK